MQFLWKYIDDLVGKGLEWTIIVKLLLLTSASLVPLALPLAILLSSIMTLGNLAEHYELAALKSAGISLQKIMRPLIVASILISIGAFYFANNILPIANLKSLSLLYDVRQQKPALDIKEGVFYNGIDGYTIKVGKKGKDGVTLYNIMIYDHTAQVGNNILYLAESGKMEFTDNNRFLTLTLKKGSSYDEQLNEERIHPLFRSNFKEEIIRFDLSEFKMTRTKEDLFKDNHQMLNIRQLKAEIDTLELEYLRRQQVFAGQMRKTLAIETVAITTKDTIVNIKEPFLSNFSKEEKQRIMETSLSIARGNKSYIENTLYEFEYKHRTVARYKIEWHRKYTLSFACLVLFFIGAPLGAIIKKGGLGLPMVVSVIFFIFFHILSITGEKFAKEEVWPVYKGMWMASVILLPIGVFLTMKATSDSAIFDKDAYINFFKKIFRKKR